MRDVKQLVALVAAFVLSTGAALGVASLADGSEDETEPTLPEVVRRLPVIEPDDGSIDPTVAADDAPGMGSGAGGGSSSGGAGSGGGGPVFVEEYDTDVAVGALPHAVRFVDPCTVGEGEDCDGTSSTVLALTDEPFDIVGVFAGGHTCAYPTRIPTPPGWLVVIASTQPGDFVVTLADHDEPEVVASARVSTLPEAIDAFEAGTLGQIITCAGLTIPLRANEFDLTVEGTSGEENDRYTTVVSYAGLGRPPVFVQRPEVTNEDQLRVVVPAKGGGEGGVFVKVNPDRARDPDPTRGEFGGGPAAGDACPHIPFGPLDREPSATTEIPADVLTADTYPYDPVWTHRYDRTFDTRDFGPGHPHELCIFWLDELNRVIDAVVYPLLPPNRFQTSFSVTRIRFDEARVPSDFDVVMLGGDCFVRLGGDELTRDQRYDFSDTETYPDMYAGSGRCNRSDGLAGYPGSTFTVPSFDPMLRVEVRGPEGESAAYIRLPLSSCPASGGACRRGDPYDIVTSVESYTVPFDGGSVTIRAQFTEPMLSRDGERFWEVGPQLRYIILTPYPAT